jgi:hypothetical protein
MNLLHIGSSRQRREAKWQNKPIENNRTKSKDLWRRRYGPEPSPAECAKQSQKIE